MTIIGHESVRGHLSRLVAAGMFPQASLFYGANGSGKKMVAVDTAKTLLCETPEAGTDSEWVRSCGRCRGCHAFDSGNHPDFSLIVATPPKGKPREDDSLSQREGQIKPLGSIRGEDIREFKNRLAYPALMAARQVILINDAELMTVKAANSLLKLLEEPRPNQVFILVTSRLHKILVTIRSRLAKFFFPPLAVDEVQKIVILGLNGETPDERLLSFYLECFPGSPAWILKAMRLKLDFATWEKMGSRQNFAEISAIAKDIIGEKIEMPLFLQGLRGFCLARVKKGGCGDGEIRLLEKITIAERQMERHIPTEFVLENLFL